MTTKCAASAAGRSRGTISANGWGCGRNRPAWGQKSGRLPAETYQSPLGFSLELRVDLLIFWKSGKMTIAEVTRQVSQSRLLTHTLFITGGKFGSFSFLSVQCTVSSSTANSLEESELNQGLNSKLHHPLWYFWRATKNSYQSLWSNTTIIKWEIISVLPIKGCYEG